MRRSRLAALVLAALVLAAGLAALPASGHPGHGAEAVAEHVAWEGDGLALVLAVHNASGGAVTLRGIRVAGATEIAFTRRRSLLGFASEEPVRFLRLDPDETRRLGEDGYRVIVRGIEPGAAALTLFLDFGPDGALLLPVPVPPR